jgi:hypothetical protein
MAQKRTAFPAERRNQNEWKMIRGEKSACEEKLEQKHGGRFIPADDFGSHRRLLIEVKAEL